jgi:magnesium-transporting ATPase (P-type)
MHATPAGTARTVLRRDPTGLTEVEARRRLRAHGANLLPAPRPPHPLGRLVAQVVHFFAVMLWIAAALALLAGMPNLAVAIAVVVILNGAFAFAQEHRAERAASSLRDLLPRRATVRRDGRRTEIDADTLVPGDVVLLGAGDRLSADLELLTTRGLRIDESMLTGESVPVTRSAGAPARAGTFVVEGEGEGLVIATGDATALADVARLTRRAVRPPSPLDRELRRVVRTIAGIAFGVGTAFFATSLLVGSPASDGFLFGVGVMVALVPEGLLPTVTLSLARSAQRMAGRRALVRDLDAVEALGATTCICTDKTGTLTANEMTVVAAWTPEGGATVHGSGYGPTARVEFDRAGAPAVTRLAAAARRCSDGRAVELDGEWRAVGDPMEAALDAFAARVGAPVRTAEGAAVPIRRIPFDPARRMMSVVIGSDLIVKGAPEAVLPRCRPAGTAADPALAALASRGLRVLAVATRSVGTGPTEDPAVLEQDLTLLGLVGLEDPPRPGSADALRAARSAGVAVVMLTGDHPATAQAIAREVGLASPGDRAVLIGDELPADDVALGALVDRDGTVVARVDPATKLRITRALQRRGHVVAVTGDGVNDGPALHAADVGVAMGRSGTDVAREAADLVLLDDEFGTIVAAIEEGRAAYANVRRFLTFHLTANVAELVPFVVWAMSGGRVPLALTVLQILCIDLIADALPALALGSERARPDTLSRPPDRRHLLDGALLRRAFLLLGPTEALVEMTAFLLTFVAAGWRAGSPVETGHHLAAASGAAFAAVVLGQTGTAFACRSTSRPVGRMRRPPNRSLRLAVVAAVLLLILMLGVPPVADVLHQAPPSPIGILVALCAPPAVLAVDALAKWIGRRRREDAIGAATPRADPLSTG